MLKNEREQYWLFDRSSAAMCAWTAGVETTVQKCRASAVIVTVV